MRFKMKKSLLPLLILAIFLGLAGCTNVSPDGTDPADVSSAETGSEISNSSQPVSSASISQSSTAAISSSSPAPTPTPIPFEFDLTEDEAVITPQALMFIGGMNEADIIGGESSPYTCGASFFYGTIEDDLDPSGIDSYVCEYSIDRSEVAFQDDNNDGSTVVLRYYNGTNVYTAATDADAYVMSLTGNAIAYTVQNLAREDLYRYDASTNESTLIAEDIGDFNSEIYISPSGDAVGFMAEGHKFHLIVGEDEREIGISGYVLAISDSGKLVYYMVINNNVYSYFVYKEGRHISLGSESRYDTVHYGNGLIFNRDLTQVLVAVNNNLYFSMDGSKAVCIASLDDEVSMPDSDSSWKFSCISTKAMIRNNNVLFLPAKNLCNQLYCFANTIFYCDANMEIRYTSTHTYENGQDSSVYGEQIAYLKYNPDYDGYDVYYTANFREPGLEVRIPVEYAEKVVLTKSQSLYIENDIGQLLLVKGDSEPLLIDTYSELIGRYEVDGSTYIYYTKKSFMEKPNNYLSDLYRIEDIQDAVPQKISSELFEACIDSTGIYIFGKSSTYTAIDYWYENILWSTDGLSFTFLCTAEYSY